MHASPPKTTYDEIDFVPEGWWESRLVANDFQNRRDACKFAKRLMTPEQLARFWEGSPWQPTPQPKSEEPIPTPPAETVEAPQPKDTPTTSATPPPLWDIPLAILLKRLDAELLHPGVFVMRSPKGDEHSAYVLTYNPEAPDGFDVCSDDDPEDVCRKLVWEKADYKKGAPWKHYETRQSACLFTREELEQRLHGVFIKGKNTLEMPGPGRPDGDRSLRIYLSPSAPHGFDAFSRDAHSRDYYRLARQRLGFETNETPPETPEGFAPKPLIEEEPRESSRVAESLDDKDAALETITQDDPPPPPEALEAEADASLRADHDVALDFLAHVRRDSDRHLVAIVPDGGITARTFKASDTAAMRAWLAEQEGKRNVYYHVNPLKPHVRNKKATKTDIAAARYLHVDVDDAEALERIQAFSPSPTVTIFSGGGFNCLWLLRDACMDLEAVETFNQRLEVALGADHCHNVDRILRVPGSINLPNKKKLEKGRVPTLAYVVEELTDWTREYALEDFEDLPPPQEGPPPKEETPKGNGASHDASFDVGMLPADLRELIIRGCYGDYGGDRSRAVWAATCGLIHQGFHDETIKAVLLDKAFKISEHVYAQRKPQQYAAKQVANARRNTGIAEGDIIRVADPAASRTIELICAKDIVPEAIKWAWKGWLAHNKLQLLVGPPNAGKSTLGFKLAATISQGALMPDGYQTTPGNVIIWSGEDSAADTIIPRLMAMGADLSRIFIVSTVTDTGKKRAFNPAQDLEGLKAAITKLPDGKVDLVVIDPFVAAVKPGKNSHNNAETRQGLAHVVDFIEETGCALLGIHHFTKNTEGKNPVDRVTGSLAIAALARIVMTAVEKNDEDEPGPKRLLTRAKNNINPNGGGFPISRAPRSDPQRSVGGARRSRMAASCSMPTAARNGAAAITTSSAISRRGLDP